MRPYGQISLPGQPGSRGFLGFGVLQGFPEGLILLRRGSTGVWYWLTSSSGYNPSVAGERVWGGSGDVPMIR